MKSKRRLLALIPLVLVALVALVGCGSSSNSSTSAATTTSTSGASNAAATGAGAIDVANNPQLGMILTDSKGNTVYLFQKDTGGSSACSGQCAAVWPPITTSGSPKAGKGITASKLGTLKRSDGSTQVTYAGHPLYTYTADSGPGDTSGNGINSFGAVWNAVQPSGSNAPSGGASGGSSTSSSGGGGGGGYGY